MQLPPCARQRCFSAPIALALLLVSATPALAQLSTTRGWSFGAHLQATTLDIEQEDDASSGGGIGLRAGYGFNRIVTGFLHLDDSRIDVPAGNEVGGTWNLLHFDLGARFHFANSLRRWVPYLEASAGARAVTIKRDLRVGVAAPEKISFNGSALTIGGGVSTFFNKNFALDASLKFTGGKFTEVDLGDVALRNVEIEASSFRFGVGVIWWP